MTHLSMGKVAGRLIVCPLGSGSIILPVGNHFVENVLYTSCQHVCCSIYTYILRVNYLPH